MKENVHVKRSGASFVECFWNWTLEIIRRSIQIIAGIFVFDCPGLSCIRKLAYRLIFRAEGKLTLSSKIMFFTPHGLKKATVIVGKGVRISENVRIDCSAPITIGDNVWISEDVSIVLHEHNLRGREPKESKDITLSGGLSILEDAWIGERAIILPRVRRVGKGAVVGAGSVVTHDVGDYEIVAGNPARKIGVRE